MSIIHLINHIPRLNQRDTSSHPDHTFLIHEDPKKTNDSWLLISHEFYFFLCMTFFFMENNIYTLFLLRKENNVDTKQTSYMGSSVGVLIF